MASSDKNTLVVLLGPTGVGKTSLSLRIAAYLRTPIINADSRQIFAELPIGTAAPTKQQQQQVRHYFVGNHHLQDYYSASLFEQDTLGLLRKLFDGEEDGIQHRNVLMSGGSMMYIDAVCNGIDDIPTVDEATRQKMKERLSAEGLAALTDELKELDPEHWKKVDRNNPRRVVHALEICHMTGKPYSSFLTRQKKERPFRIIKIGLERPRDEMYERINQRVLDMMDEGLLDEAHQVYPYKHLNALNTVGYKELFSYFEGNIPLEEAIRQIQSNTRRYMRKQLTWFKKDTTIKWFHADNIEDILNYIKDRCA